MGTGLRARSRRRHGGLAAFRDKLRPVGPNHEIVPFDDTLSVKRDCLQEVDERLRAELFLDFGVVTAPNGQEFETRLSLTWVWGRWRGRDGGARTVGRHRAYFSPDDVPDSNETSYRRPPGAKTGTTRKDGTPLA
jgi:hypothetical protein